ncbi:MAG: hypothetical protein ACLFVY_04265 [Phycisphaerae bacterium]
MTKRQMIDEIITMNTSADPGFLAEFDSDDLSAYMNKLRRAIYEENAGPARKRQYSPYVHRQSDEGQFVAVDAPLKQKSVATVVLESADLEPAKGADQQSDELLDHPTLFDLH